MRWLAFLSTLAVDALVLAIDLLHPTPVVRPRAEVLRDDMDEECERAMRDGDLLGAAFRRSVG